jgi:hypothetical protein
MCLNSGGTMEYRGQSNFDPNGADRAASRLLAFRNFIARHPRPKPPHVDPHPNRLPPFAVTPCCPARPDNHCNRNDSLCPAIERNKMIPSGECAPARIRKFGFMPDHRQADRALGQPGNCLWVPTHRA